MAHDGTPFQLLYVSHLAAGRDFAVMKAIGVGSRLHNRSRNLTGALLFDGERFCQLIEGAEHDVRALMERIAIDPRHTAVQVLFAGPARAGGRMTQRWASGYCEPGRLDAFSAAHGVTSDAAVDSFATILAIADME